MLTPKNKTQTAILWGVALVIALLMSVITSIMEQPIDQPINWRLVFNDVGRTLTTLIPPVLVGLGVPRLGGEHRAALIDEIGKETADNLLQTAANIKSETRIQPSYTNEELRVIAQADDILQRYREHYRNPTITESERE